MLWSTEINFQNGYTIETTASLASLTCNQQARLVQFARCNTWTANNAADGTRSANRP